MIYRAGVWTLSIAALLLVSCLSFAQDDDTPEPAVSAQQYADRARRLRQFGYPEYARRQLEEGARKYPTDKPIVLEHLRLLAHAGESEIRPWVKLAQDRYPYDYDIALEIARYLYLNEYEPDAPLPENLETAKTRLKAEMTVYVALADYILEPTDELPAAADQSKTPSPALALAYLARCAKAKPDSTEVIEFAARCVDILSCRFDDWSTLHPSFTLFRKAADDLFPRAIKLWDRAEDDERYTGYARMRMSELCLRAGDLEGARKNADAADLVVPGSRAIAEVLQAIAERTGDLPLLIKALERKRDAYPNETSRLDVLAAKRIQANEWPLAMWQAWVELRHLAGLRRGSAIRVLLEEKPEFLEVHFLDAALSVEVGMSDNPPVEPVRALEAALAALDRCEGLGESLVDWHGLRATTLWSLARFAEAAESFAKVAEMDPRDAQARQYAKAARDIAAGKYTAADWEMYQSATSSYGELTETLDTLLKITARVPKFFEAQVATSELALMLARHQEAYNAASAAVKLVPENLAALENAARAAMWLSKFQQAADWFFRMNELSAGLNDADRWHSLCAWAAANADKQQQQAIVLWLQSNARSITETEKRRLLEQAVRLAPTLPEPLVDLAELEHERGEDPHAMELLATAQKHHRDHWMLALIHRTRGKVFAKQRNAEKAISEFESAYSAYRGDGGDLMLSALTLHSMDDNAGASAALRRLFTECPRTLLLRPSPTEIHQLDLLPPEIEQPVRDLSPKYNVGDRLSFRVAIVVSGEGKGQFTGEVRTEFDMLAEVLEVPLHGGVWKLKLSFDDPPAPVWDGLKLVTTTAIISPWFGLCEEPAADVDAKLRDVIHPAIQALTEGLTAGLGDAPIARPYVWKNNLTKGPPHFGNPDARRDSLPNPEGSYLSSVTGDSFTITRRALAGRRVGTELARDQNFSRGLEAMVEAGGPRNTLRKVMFEVAKEELSPQRDDVIRTHLQVSITAK